MWKLLLLKMCVLSLCPKILFLSFAQHHFSNCSNPQDSSQIPSLSTEPCKDEQNHQAQSLKHKLICLPCFKPVYQVSLVAQTVKSLPAVQQNRGSVPGWGTSPGEGNGNPLQYSCLENAMDGGAWQGTVHGVAKSQTWLSNFTFTLPCFTPPCLQSEPNLPFPWDLAPQISILYIFH